MNILPPPSLPLRNRSRIGRSSVVFCGGIVVVILGWQWCMGSLGLRFSTGSQVLAADTVAKATAETRDAFLLLDTGLVHLRMHVSIGGKSPVAARQEAAARLLNTLDENHDGKLSWDESQKSMLFREKPRPGAEKFLKSIGSERNLSLREIEQKFESTGGEQVVYRQNTNAAQIDTRIFSQLDRDANSRLDQDEIADAVDQLLAFDQDDDECLSLGEFQPEPIAPVVPVAVVPMQSTRPALANSELLRDARQTLLPANVMQKYDRDKNRFLTADELGWDAERLAAIDANRDGKLSVDELKQLAKSHVDIELRIDPVRQGDGGQMLELLHIAGDEPRSKTGDYAKVTLSRAVVALSAREVDPFAASLETAIRVFNELDMDANGYLTKEETTTRERFGRGLFEQIDLDGDGKIFGEEMKAFIQARGEPAAQTCQVTLFDDGTGFFATLDVNGDRRISIRELRYADRSLHALKRTPEPGLALDEAPRHFRIEFSRGVFQPFGPDRQAMQMNDGSDLPVGPTKSVGPSWFQRWDRNNDGDLTWREFLGPRSEYERLDADGDDLIDVEEAEAAERRHTMTSTSRPSAR